MDDQGRAYLGQIIIKWWLLYKAVMEREERLLTISEVSKRLNIPKHTLGFREKEFTGLFAPQRTQEDQRRFNDEHIAVLMKIKAMKEMGMGLSEIKRVLGNGRMNTPQEISPIDLLAHRLADLVRGKL